jgi:hypothetical protein
MPRQSRRWQDLRDFFRPLDGEPRGASGRYLPCREHVLAGHRPNLQADDRMEVLLCARQHELAVRSTETPIDIAIVPWLRSADGYPWLDRLGRPRCRTVVG